LYPHCPMGIHYICVACLVIVVCTQCHWLSGYPTFLEGQKKGCYILFYSLIFGCWTIISIK
jgi:hypothetical protein